MLKNVEAMKKAVVVKDRRENKRVKSQNRIKQKRRE